MHLSRSLITELKLIKIPIKGLLPMKIRQNFGPSYETY